MGQLVYSTFEKERRNERCKNERRNERQSQYLGVRYTPGGLWRHRRGALRCVLGGDEHLPAPRGRERNVPPGGCGVDLLWRRLWFVGRLAGRSHRQPAGGYPDGLGC